KSCFNRLVELSGNAEDKWNWYSQTVKFLKKCEVKGIKNDLNFVSNNRKIVLIMHNFEINVTNKNVEFMLKNSEHYTSLKSRIGTEKYLESDISFKTKQLYFQFRC